MVPYTGQNEEGDKAVLRSPGVIGQYVQALAAATFPLLMFTAGDCWKGLSQAQAGQTRSGRPWPSPNPSVFLKPSPSFAHFLRLTTKVHL